VTRVAAPFLTRLVRKASVSIPEGYPGTLPFVTDLELEIDSAVTIFVGENGSGKSTLLEAIATLCGLPSGGGGRTELADFKAPQTHGELAPFLRASFRAKPRSGYFFRAEFQAHFASLLEQRRDDPDFMGDPFARYGGRSLHTRSHGEAFLEMFAAWLEPGIILMDEPEAALSPQRQLALLAKMAELVRTSTVQFILATHSPVIMTFPGAALLSFDGGRITPIALEDTSHYRITKDLLDAPERYWRHLLAEGESAP